jgi:cyclase
MIMALRMGSKTVKRIFTSRMMIWSVAAAAGWLVVGTASSRAADDGGIDVVKVRQNFYMIAGDGGNIAVELGTDGIVLTNAGAGNMSDKVLEELKKLSDLPIRYIINTNVDPDFVGGNLKLSANPFALGVVTNSQGHAAILAHQSILTKMSARDAKPSYPGDAWPNEAFLAKRHSMRMNDEGIEILYQPAAHSDSDSFVMFRKSDVVVAGDIMDTTRFPVIDVAHGGSIQGEIDALNKLIELTIAPIPYIYKDVGTYVIPGHGRLSEQMEVVDYRDMVVTLRDNVAELMKQGKTLDQIKAAHPALAYETRYGRQPGVTDSFLESVYKSISAKK